VLCLDAANPKSYGGSGTVWKDLSGNGNNGTLTNGPTFDSGNGGSISFDGVNDYTIIGNTTPSSLLGNPVFTVEGWFKKSGSWSGGSTWGIGGNGSLQGINSWTAGATDIISIDLWGTSTYSTGQTYSANIWKYCVWIYRGSTFTTSNISIYIDTVEYTGLSLQILRGGSGTPNINNSGIVLGRAGTIENAYYGKPVISNFKIYNRALSNTEILQNYNATKSRFGL